MKEIERIREYTDELSNIEELILESTFGLNVGEVSISDAKRQISGLEKNCIITKLNPSFLEENPYIKNIHIENWFVGNIGLTNTTEYEEYKTYAYEMRRRDPKSLTTIYNFCYFPKTVPFPTIGTVIPESKWMGVEPSEISSFAPFIKEAHGKILLMGCGLGYVAYMLSLKDEVEEITIVELDRNVKAMFETYLKPQMNSKISIIEGDALEFLEVEDISKYDYCSIDIWHGAMEMFPIYTKCLLLEEKHKDTKFHYWLEEDLHTLLETIWIMILRKRANNDPINRDLEMFTSILDKNNINTVEDIKKFLMTPKRQIITDWALANRDSARNQENLSLVIEKTLKNR